MKHCINNPMECGICKGDCDVRQNEAVTISPQMKALVIEIDAIVFKQLLAAMRDELVNFAKLRGVYNEEMFRRAIFSGWMNGIDPNSPHCAKTLEQACKNFVGGVAYIQRYSGNES